MQLALRTRVLRWQAFTMAWMSVEAAVSLWAAWTAGSIALAAFGGDSVVELASATVVFVRFQRPGALQERVAARLAGGLLLLLAAAVAVASVADLAGWRKPQSSPAGIVLLIVAAIVMPWLGRRKRELAAATKSAALKADATQSSLCGYLAWIALAGLVINAWWSAPWADSVAAMGLVPLIGIEGWTTLREAKLCQDCCD
jgi:divalent metal cation (Fe/Co/Zn/Cd) transporter